jgi:hypothetical protein
MPTIPKYSGNPVSPDVQKLPHEQADTSMVQSASGWGDVIGQVQKIGVSVYKKQAEAELLDANINDAKIDADALGAATAIKGPNVASALDLYDDVLEANSAEIKKSLRNPLARKMYEKEHKRRLALGRVRVGKYINDESERAYALNVSAAKTIAINDVVTDSEIPELMVERLSDAQTSIDREAVLKFGDTESTASKQWIEGQRAEVLARVLLRQIETGNTENYELYETSASQTGFIGPEKMNDVKKIVFSESKKITARKYEEAFEAAEKWMDANPGRDPKTNIPDIWGQLKPNHQKALLSDTTVTDWDAWNRFLRTTAEEKATMPLSEFESKYQSRLSPALKLEASRIWAGYQGGATKHTKASAQSSLSGFRTSDKIANTVIRSFGYNPESKGKSQKNSVEEIKNRISFREEREIKAKGRKLTDSEFKVIAEQEAFDYRRESGKMRIHVDGKGVSSEKVPPGMSGSIWVDKNDIPKDQFQTIRGVLYKALGAWPTESEIGRYYYLWQDDPDGFRDVVSKIKRRELTRGDLR